jgi:putative tricarboxylic transport membrane protein
MQSTHSAKEGRADVGAGVLLFALGILILAGTPGIEATHTTDPLGPRFLPRLLAIILMFLSAWLIVDGARQMGGKHAKDAASGAAWERAEDEPIPPTPAADTGKRRVLLIVAAMALYVGLMPLIGYEIGSVLFFLAMLWIAGQRRPVMLIVQAVGTMIVLYVLFGVILGINLPEGILSLRALR